MKKWIPLAVAIAVSAGIAVAGSIKVWNSGDFVLASDLNANFAHIHNTMVGGHGARLVDSDVSANANIATTKLAGAALVAKMTLLVGVAGGGGSSPTECAGGALASCTVLRDVGLTASVAHSPAANGEYYVTFGVARPTSNYTAVVTGVKNSAAVVSCGIVNQTTTVITVQCWKMSATVGTLTDAAFTIVLFDSP